MSQKHFLYLSQHLNLAPKQVENTIQLLEGGATVPFISRYRKEATGALDEVAVSSIQKHFKQLKALEKRRKSILSSIEEQGKLTTELRKKIESTMDARVLEDLYLPFKKKRKTRASMAREKGLEPLAKKIFLQRENQLELLARAFINSDVPGMEEALQGARDIIAEWINEDEKSRKKIRFLFEREANIKSSLARGKEEEAQKYRDYFDYEEALKKCPSHRMLAIRRGEEEGLLRVSIGPDQDRALYQLARLYLKGTGAATKQVEQALEDAYKRLLAPSIETEFRASSKRKADNEAISVFAKNLRQLLLAPPLGQKKILAIDPGFRTGCKVVCLSQSGALLQYSTIFPHPPQSDRLNAKNEIKNLIKKFRIEAIAIGNGTAGRETLAFCKEIQLGPDLQIFLVNESGASIYSASKIARQEFPDHDLTVRGAVSIGRRLMDPLAELVKIDPKSIGVGQYQHDVNQTQLKESLDQLVESCVNSVGINLNTASEHLLSYVSGLGPVLAKNIVDFRSEIDTFKSRHELKKVPRMGEKAFEQCAGFLRIKAAKQPLDNTAVHPETYPIVEQMASDLGCSIQELTGNKVLRKQINLADYVNNKIGLPTLEDILAELEKPGLDPRGNAKPVEFSNQIKSIEDLKIGMILPGIINNITNFGAFVDIGIKQGGLIHISQISDQFVKNPADHLQVQQEVKVKVLAIDMQRGRITLSMKPSEVN